MRVLVVYDSVFGNTEKVARAIGEALRPDMEVETTRVSEAAPASLEGVGLLFVGSPTRAFRPTPATKKFIQSIPPKALKSTKVAAFDTGIPADQSAPWFLRVMMRLFGYAAGPILKGLEKRGGDPAGAEGFFVTGTEGPLREGELERAAAWARRAAGIGGTS
jgi:flavodoxin